MTTLPLPLDDHHADLDAIGKIPVQVQHRHVDLMIMIGDEHCRSDRLVLVDDIPQDLAQHDRASALGRFWRQTAREMDPASTAVVTICRHGPHVPAGDDFAWHDVVRATAATARISVLGVFLSTPTGVVEIVPLAA